jgi:hypothetical protein
MNGKYPMLYIEQPKFHSGLNLNAYALSHRKVFVGKEKLTDLLDELYQLRKEKYERENSKEVTTDGPTHSDRADEGKGK